MAWISGYQKWLSQSESLNNAQEVANYFKGTDWSKASLSAMLGNMRHESSVNPNMYEYGYDWSADRGYGLVQWTPRSKYWNWAIGQGLDPENHNSQLARITYEIANNIQWIANGHQRRYGMGDKYNITFAQFRTNSVGYSLNQLTEAFMWNYEGPNYTAGSNSLHDRQSFAALVLDTINFEGGTTTTPPPEPTPTPTPTPEPEPEPTPEPTPTPVTTTTTDQEIAMHLWLSHALRW